MTSTTPPSQLDFLIPSYNGRELLIEHLRDSIGQIEKHGALVIIDDASTDGSVEMLGREFPSARVIARAKNGGFSAAVNDGIRATDGEFVVLLNNDVEITPGFLDPIMPLFEDKNVFSVSPRVILPSRGDMDEGAKSGFWHHGMFYPDQRQDVTEVTPILYTTGCAAVYRRSMLNELGGLDEAYSPFYWEDADLGYRAWKRGWKSLYQPASMVYHQHSVSTSRMKQSFTGRIRARNGLFFIWRNLEDERLISEHRRWLPLVLARRIAAGDSVFAAGWKDAYTRRRECINARNRDSSHRCLSDRQIFDAVGISLP